MSTHEIVTTGRSPGIPEVAFSVDLDHDRCTMRLHGELEDETAAVLTGVVEGQIGSGCVDLLVDLAGLTFFDLRGFAAISAAQSRLRALGGRLGVVNGSRLFVTVAQWWGLGDLLDVDPRWHEPAGATGRHPGPSDGLPDAAPAVPT